MEKPGSMPIDGIIRLAIIGDASAFTSLWDAHIVQLRKFLKKWLKNLDDFYIDDICSRSFEKAFRQIKTFDPAQASFGTWLFSIARNTALDLIKQESRQSGRFVSLDFAKEGLAAMDVMEEPSQTALDAIISDEDRERTMACIQGLPDLYRDIASKRLLEGMTYKEIAEETGIELNTVRTRIRRAKALMESMKENEI